MDRPVPGSITRCVAVSAMYTAKSEIYCRIDLCGSGIFLFAIVRGVARSRLSIIPSSECYFFFTILISGFFKHGFSLSFVKKNIPFCYFTSSMWNKSRAVKQNCICWQSIAESLAQVYSSCLYRERAVVMLVDMR